MQRYKILVSGDYKNYSKGAGVYLGHSAISLTHGDIFEFPEDYATPLVKSGLIEVCEPKNIAPPEPPVPVEINATDAAIELAQENGIDLSLVTGSGSGGRILKSDVVDIMEANHAS